MEMRVYAVGIPGVTHVADELALRAHSARRSSPGAYDTPATQVPRLSFRAVRSLFRWMYWYVVPLRPYR